MWRPLIWIAHLICTIAAINWGLFVFFNFNIVASIATTTQIVYLDSIIYIIITLAGLYGFAGLFSPRKTYNKGV